MHVPNDPTAVFHFRNRTLILVAAPPIAVLCLAMILSNLRSGEPWLNWLAGLLLWLFLLLVGLRRRLVFKPQGLEYTEFFTTTSVPWDRLTRLVSRKALAIWPVEGLEAWTMPPSPRDVFMELTQFHRSWRNTALGAQLKASAPQLFQKPGVTASAAQQLG